MLFWRFDFWVPCVERKEVGPDRVFSVLLVIIAFIGTSTQLRCLDTIKLCCGCGCCCSCTFESLLFLSPIEGV